MSRGKNECDKQNVQRRKKRVIIKSKLCLLLSYAHFQSFGIHSSMSDTLPSPKLASSWGQVTQVAEFLGLEARSQLLALKGVRGACCKLRDRLGRGTSLLNYMALYPNPTNKLVRTHSAPFWCWDKSWAILDSLDSPRPRFEGSHHLPPYIILCSFLPHLHPNGSFSWDFQSGVPKLSRFELPGLWTLITFRLKLGSGRGLNQTCSFLRELSNGVSHCT